ncbi:MAG: RluA family pseudouridine synthase [Chitinophagaceae bacterium]|nr:RluA family pseudouridine synthase [Chitinophagaceae bacterium]MCW5904345.1 RluA family pseudouridine synthase [Chitinophagaceae bacterium]
MQKLDIIFENDFFIAINKPSGLLSVPDRKQSEPSLKDILIEKYGHIFTVHRLDKDTSGVIVFAKDAATHKQLSQLFESRAIEKYYVGLVHGRLLHTSESIDAPIMQHPADNGKMLIHQKGKPSLTDYTLLEQFKFFAWVQFQIHTGRTHQIRIHTKHIGNSIVCDNLYGDGNPILLSALKRNFKLSKNSDEEKPILNRLALHSSKLIFDFNNQHFSLEAPLPKDLKALLQQLRKVNK